MTAPTMTGFARGTYAAAVAGLGALLVSDRFVYVWAPIPAWVPARTVLASAAGALMLVAALLLFWRKAVARSSLVLAFLFLAWLLLVHVPRIASMPLREILWAGGGQIASVVAGAWLLTDGPWLGRDRTARWARSMYAVALPFFGLHHFLGAAGAAAAVPEWLPFRLGWAYLTGAAHVAAGVAILLGIVPRLAAILEAIMIGAFVLLVHVPGVIHAPGDRLQWTMLVVASAIDGAAWIVAASYARSAK